MDSIQQQERVLNAHLIHGATEQHRVRIVHAKHVHQQLGNVLVAMVGMDSIQHQERALNAHLIHGAMEQQRVRIVHHARHVHQQLGYV